VHLKGAELTVRDSHRGRGDIVASLDVGETALLHPGDGEVRRQGNGDLLPCLGCDRQGLSLKLLDGPADAGGCSLWRLRRGRGSREHQQGRPKHNRSHDALCASLNSL
jgi:hypothetical protein